jgi:multidrug resistance efflux pump
MFRIRWWVAGAILLAASGARGQAPDQDPNEARPIGPDVVDVVNRAERPAPISRVVPDAHPVKEGETVCVLESIDLKAPLDAAENALKRAEARREQARLSREIAELDLGAYTQVEGPLAVDRLEGRVQIAEGELALARRRFEAGQKAPDGAGPVSRVEDLEARLGLRRAEFAMREAQTSLQVLRQFGGARRKKELQLAVERVREEEREAVRSLEAEDAKAEGLRQQVVRHEIKAPRDGVFRKALAYRVERGATLRPGQLIGWIVPADEGHDEADDEAKPDAVPAPAPLPPPAP